MGPQLYVLLALLAATPATYGVMWVKRELATKAAYEQGFQAGKALASAPAIEGATRTMAAERQAQAEVPPVSPDRAAIIARCKQSASCKERGTLR